MGCSEGAFNNIPVGSFKLCSRCFLTGVKAAPGVVNADVYRNYSRLQLQTVLVPAPLQIRRTVAADSAVDKGQLLLGIQQSQPCGYHQCIAHTKRRRVFIVAAPIRNAVTLEQNDIVFLKFHPESPPMKQLL
ncbi:hypothetical protein D3C75_1001500 [compost metagenome]